MGKYDFKLNLETVNSLSVIAKLIKNDSIILELGPGNGYLTEYLSLSKQCTVDIVEMDRDSGNLAKKFANIALIGEEEGDIEKYIWLDILKEKKYDYIILADVLEHLYNPWKVLETLKDLLADNGKLIISIPNICHDAILINMFENKFSYTDVGLLDNTHIRFWGIKNIEDFVKNAGFEIYNLTCVKQNAIDIEQAAFFDDNWKNLKVLFQNREFGDTYQFVFELKKDEGRKYTFKYQKQAQMNLFCDFGEGFNIENVITNSVTIGDYNNYTFKIKNGVKALRLDPVEGYWVNVSELAIKVNGIKVKENVISKEKITINNNDIFFTNDPMYIIEIPNDTDEDVYVEIQYKIDYIDFQDSAVEIIKSNGLKDEELQSKTEELQSKTEELQSKTEELQSKTEELQSKNEELEIKVKECHQLKLTDDIIKRELNHYKEHYHAAIQQRNNLQLELQVAKTSYDIIANSFFWKITQPARTLLDKTKQILKKNKYSYLTCKGILSIKENGIKVTLEKIKNKLKQKNINIENINLIANNLSQEERNLQKESKFENNVKFSIIVPLYNTPEKFIDELIVSLINQTYSNWEICFGDGSSSDSERIRLEKKIKKYTKEKLKNKIKYKSIGENKGIAGNTIEAYKLSKGDYIVLADHDDILTEDALYELAIAIQREPESDFIYSDKGIFDDQTGRILAYHYLPEYSPEFLRSTNYASHINAFSRRIIDEVGFIREGYDGSQDYDFELRVVEKARKIVSIPKVLYYCRACEGSVALDPESKMYAYEAGRRAIEEHIERIGIGGTVEFIKQTFSYRIHYNLLKKSKVSIIIPNKDHSEDLLRCVNSILNKTDYDNYEIVIVENNSVEESTFETYDLLNNNERITILEHDINEFNFSATNNYAVEMTDSEYILFLNNDTEVINSNWLNEMLMYAQREDVGAVGAKLLYPDKTYQHLGLFIGLGGHIASNYGVREKNGYTGYMHRLSMVQNYNAVTAACLLVKRRDFMMVGGFDEKNFKIGLNDVDICLKLRELGKVNVFTPYAELYHYESISRGSDESGPNKDRFGKEQALFREKWEKYYESTDCYYNPNLRL